MTDAPHARVAALRGEPDEQGEPAAKRIGQALKYLSFRRSRFISMTPMRLRCFDETQENHIDLRKEAASTTESLSLVTSVVRLQLARGARREPNHPSSLLRSSVQGTPGSSPERIASARRLISSMSSMEIAAGGSSESSSIAASFSRSSGGRAIASLTIFGGVMLTS